MPFRQGAGGDERKEMAKPEPPSAGRLAAEERRSSGRRLAQDDPAGPEAMAEQRAAGVMDELARRVYQVELARCGVFSEFKQALGLILRNLDELSAALQGAWPDDGRIRGAVESVRLRAVRLSRLCRSVWDSLDEAEDWRTIAGHIAANYDILRFEAGHLYQLVSPNSPFCVLRSAL